MYIENNIRPIFPRFIEGNQNQVKSNFHKWIPFSFDQFHQLHYHQLSHKISVSLSLVSEYNYAQEKMKTEG